MSSETSSEGMLRSSGGISLRSSSGDSLKLTARPYTPPNYHLRISLSLHQIMLYLAKSVNDPTQNFVCLLPLNMNQRFLVEITTYRCKVIGYSNPYWKAVNWYSDSRVYGATIDSEGQLEFSVWSLSPKEMVRDICENTEMVPHQFSELITFLHPEEIVNKVYHPAGYNRKPEFTGKLFNQICEDFGVWFPTGKLVLQPSNNLRPYAQYQKLESLIRN